MVLQHDKHVVTDISFTDRRLMFNRGAKLCSKSRLKLKPCQHLWARPPWLFFLMNFTLITHEQTKKLSLQFSFFILVWLLSRDRLFTRIFTQLGVIRSEVTILEFCGSFECCYCFTVVTCKTYKPCQWKASSPSREVYVPIHGIHSLLLIRKL